MDGWTDRYKNGHTNEIMLDWLTDGRRKTGIEGMEECVSNIIKLVSLTLLILSQLITTPRQTCTKHVALTIQCSNKP